MEFFNTTDVGQTRDLIDGEASLPWNLHALDLATGLAFRWPKGSDFAAEVIENLGPYGYFMQITADDRPVRIGAPTQFKSETSAATPAEPGVSQTRLALESSAALFIVNRGKNSYFSNGFRRHPRWFTEA